jgi:hypothetical protein
VSGADFDGDQRFDVVTGAADPIDFEGATRADRDLLAMEQSSTCS